ncbi:MAG: TA system VapC family ribonuclease toxin [Bryobacteraceae bacterium]
MIAVDSNLLVYSVREDSPFHREALHCVRQLAESDHPWAITWPSIHEFLAIVTHPKVYRPPTPLSDAIQQVEHWMESPTLRLLGEPERYWHHLKSLLLAGKVIGPVIHDARIASICRAQGVVELWTADRDYSRFPGIAVRNPLHSR